MAKILIVEDQLLIALDVVRCLESHGHTVVATTTSGDEAIRLAKDSNPDLVLLDIKLEGDLDGIQAGVVIRKTTGAALIFLTAHGDDLTVQRAQLASPASFLVKPFKDVDLLAAVTTAISQNTREQELFDTSQQVDEPQPLSLNTVEDRESFFREIPIFTRISRGELRLLAQSGTIEFIKKGGYLAEGSGDIPGPFVVVDGRIGVVSELGNGSEIIFALIGSHDVLGFCQAFGQDPTIGTGAKWRFRATRPTTVVRIPQAIFRSLVERNPIMASDLANEISLRLQQANSYARSMVLDQSEQRVARTLRSLLPIFSRKLTGAPDGALLDVSRTELAGLSGLTLETTVRVLNGFKNAGLVRLDNRRFIEIPSATAIDNFLSKDLANSTRATS